MSYFAGGSSRPQPRERLLGATAPPKGRAHVCHRPATVQNHSRATEALMFATRPLELIG